jgi:RNA polymerase sigma-70 factor, ECF subfamily
MDNIRVGNTTMNTAATLDRQALADIYERYNADIFRYACRLLDDRDLAEDCVAETFSRFLQSVRGGGQPDNVRAYLYRAAHNWVIDQHRRKPQPELALEESLHSDPENNPAQQVTKRMERQRVRTALLRLPAEQRQVVELRFVEEWSHQDVAAALGKTIEATRTLQHRAVTTLRQMLSEEIQTHQKEKSK